MDAKLKKQLVIQKIQKKHVGIDAVYEDKYTLDEFIDKIASILSCGIKIIQLNGKNLTDKQFLDCANKVKQLCELFDGTLIIKNRADIAYLSKADCVNLEQDSIDIRQVKEIIGEEILIGLYINTKSDVLCAVKDGADYISINQIFPTPTEPVKNTGLEYAKWVSENNFCPVLLSGNININNYQNFADINMISFLFDNSILNSYTPNLVTENFLK